MDLISSRSMKIMQLAMDGLAERHKAITSNIANAETPGFQRSEVVFEDQLLDIINNQKEQDAQKLQNSYPTVYQTDDTIFNNNLSYNSAVGVMNAKRTYGDFCPQTIADEESPATEDGNNVNIEKEMVELSKNGSRYSVLAELESRAGKEIMDVIRGGGV